MRRRNYQAEPRHPSAVMVNSAIYRFGKSFDRANAQRTSVGRLHHACIETRRIVWIGVKQVFHESNVLVDDATISRFHVLGNTEHFVESALIVLIKTSDRVGYGVHLSISPLSELRKITLSIRFPVTHNVIVNA